MKLKQETIMHLTRSQETTYNSFKDFSNNEQDVMIIKGAAGTGKTTLMKKLIKYLKKKDISYSLLAPTGRAVKILQEKSNQSASTIHKSIYSLIGMSGDLLNGNIKHIFNIRNNNEESDNHIYLIDESSMISDLVNISENFSFGTGNLLADILTYTNILSSINNRKIIFIGDDFQLPPIKTLESPTLNSSYLTINYKLKVREEKLKEIIRQKSNSSILENAHIVRDKENEINLYRKLNLLMKEEVKKSDIADIYNLYKERSNINSNIIIAQTNNSVYNYNKIIRNFLFDNTSNQIQKGERLLITENNYNFPINLMNGDFIQVDEYIKKEERTINLRGREPVILSFSDLLIQTIDSPNSISSFKVKILNNLLDSNQSFLTRELRSALIVDLIQRNKNIKPQSKEFQEIMKRDPYYNCLKIKYGYAITCHKSQGGEWKNVVVDLSSTKMYISKDYRRWLYTAITRATHNLYLLNTHLLENDLFTQVLIQDSKNNNVVVQC